MNGLSADAAADHGAWEFDPSTNKARWSAALYRMHGVSPESFEPTLETVMPLVHPDDRDTYTEIVRDALETRTPFACQHRIVRADGDTRILTVRGSFVEGVDGAPDRLIGTTQDVTAQEDEEERLWHLANHDSLSGLFNRRRFMEELTREVAYARRSGTSGSVLMLDLDHFKEINDSMGHRAGDTVLRKVAAELREFLRTTDTVARIGGDEFAAVLPACSADFAVQVATRLLDSLRDDAAIDIGGVTKEITGSVGISVFEADDDRAPDVILAEADIAMYRAKADGRARIAVFDEAMRAEIDARASTEGELREAVGGHGLSVHYQPIVAVEEGEVAGCEALVRWEHPERGTVGPNDFVSIAEESGLIAKIGRFVLTTACQQAMEWRRDGLDLFVCVNVSPLQLARDDMVDDVAGALASSGLPPHLLYLEVAETSVIHDARPLLATLRKLKALGVRISIDDFGGGASSLGLLRVMPVDQIKIDRIFIHGIESDANDRAIVSAVLSLAAELDLPVVAEGVETDRQLHELRSLRAPLAQGYLFAAPTEASELDLEAARRLAVDPALPLS